MLCIDSRKHLLLQQIIVFCVAFISFCLYKSSRKALSTVKGALMTQAWFKGIDNFRDDEFVCISMMQNATTIRTLNVNLRLTSIPRSKFDSTTIRPEDVVFDCKAEAENFLGILDGIFMFVYAIGLYIAGYLGDHWRPNYVIVLGMFSSGITLWLFGGLTELLGFYNIPYYIVIYGLFGFLQATGYPCHVSIVSNWVSVKNRGLVLGLWSASNSGGNIVGNFLSSLVLNNGYEWAFTLQSILMICGGVLFFLFVPPFPHEDFNLDEEPKDEEEQQRALLDTVEHKHRKKSIIDDTGEVDYLQHREHYKPMTIFQTIFLPGVIVSPQDQGSRGSLLITYCIVCACVKFSNNAFFFWLPHYLYDNFRWDLDVADQTANWYDIGGIIGSILAGFVSDLIRCRTPVVVIMLTISIPLLFVYSITPGEMLVNSVVMFAVGFFVAGPTNLVVSTISADLGSQAAMADHKEAKTTVIGLIDGTGSIASAIGQVIIPFVQSNLGWAYDFYLFMAINALAVICLIRRLIQEVRGLIGRCFPSSPPVDEYSPLIDSTEPPKYIR